MQVRAVDKTLQNVTHNIRALGDFGSPSIISTYLVEGETIAIIDSGPEPAAKQIIVALGENGVDLGTVSHVILTHIHLDHAGGAWTLLEKMPNAKVVVHERGAKHLIDPSRLVRSASQALGEIFQFMGETRPIPSSRVITAHDGDVIDIGNARLVLSETPGHASHHMAIFEESTRSLFPGDAMGTILPALDALFPASPPPSYDHVLAIGTMRRLEDYNPKMILLPHFGVVHDCKDFFRRNFLMYTRWLGIIAQQRRFSVALRDMEQALSGQYPEYDELLSSEFENPVMRGFFRVSIQGYIDYLSKVSPDNIFGSAKD